MFETFNAALPVALADGRREQRAASAVRCERHFGRHVPWCDATERFVVWMKAGGEFQVGCWVVGCAQLSRLSERLDWKRNGRHVGQLLRRKDELVWLHVETAQPALTTSAESRPTTIFLCEFKTASQSLYALIMRNICARGETVRAIAMPIKNK